MTSRGYRISIVIPIAESKALHLKFMDYIYEVIESGHEVILVVDQKRNESLNLNTTKAIREMSQSPRDNFKIITGEFGSPGTARNLGKNLSSGKWICFWDADDYPKLDDALHFVDEIDTLSADIGIASAELVSPNQSLMHLGSSMKEIVKWPGLWRMVFRRECIRDINFEDWDWCEDQDFILKSLSSATLICTSDIPIYQYHLHVPKSSTSRTSSWKSILTFISAIKSRMATNVVTRLDVLFLIKNLYSLRKYLDLISWIKELVLALPHVISIIRLRSITLNELED